jgi:hypothetical protein
MPQVNNPNSVAASLPGQFAQIRADLADLKGSSVFNPLNLNVGTGGIIDNGPLFVSGPTSMSVLTVAGATTLTGGVTGPIAATGALSGTTVTGTGAITGASLAVAGAATAASVATTGNVAATGQVISTGIVQSAGSRAYNVVAAGGYVGTWQDVNGNFGFNPSGVEFKQDFQPADPAAIVDAVLHIALIRYRFIDDLALNGANARLHLGTIAQYLAAGPLAEWVASTDAGSAINWEQFAIPLVATVQALDARLKKLELPSV